MSAQHTPGPWTYGTHESGWSYTINVSQAEGAAYTPDYSDVAWSTCSGEKQAVQEANARLIATAPELLAALQEWIEDPFTNQNQARAAIAKATGSAS